MKKNQGIEKKFLDILFPQRYMPFVGFVLMWIGV